MTTFEKLEKRIEKDTGYLLQDFRRTYRGKNQISGATWSWSAYCPEIGDQVGSEETATELLKRKEKLNISPPMGGHSSYSIF